MRPADFPSKEPYRLSVRFTISELIGNGNWWKEEGEE
jgi:hypothetical protein